LANSNQKTPENKTDVSPDLATVGGIAAGAAAGSLLGPLGAAVGALVGGAAGKNASRKSHNGKKQPASLVTKAAKNVRTAARKTNSTAKKGPVGTKVVAKAKPTKNAGAKKKR
jgi:hypothetical protein